MNKPLRDISLFDVLAPFEGWDDPESLCVASHKNCACAVQTMWKRLEKAMFQPLKEKSLQSACRRIKG